MSKIKTVAMLRNSGWEYDRYESSLTKDGVGITMLNGMIEHCGKEVSVISNINDRSTFEIIGSPFTFPIEVLYEC